jgi:hypothetical protein
MPVPKLIRKLFGWRHPQNNHDFTEEDNDKAQESRKVNAAMKRQNDLLLDELKHLEYIQRQRHLKEKIAMIQDEMYDDDDEDDDEDEDDDADPFENMMKAAAVSMIAKMQPHLQPQQTTETASKVTISDEQIRGLLSKVPKQYVKMAKKMDDSSIYTQLKSYAPQYDDATLHRAIEIFRDEY